MKTLNAENTGRGLSFAKRIYLPRCIGLAVGSVSVGACMLSMGVAQWVWVLLFLHAWIWPHLAFQRSRRSGHPYRAELHNILLDAFMGGVWLAMLGFSPVATVSITAMIAMQNIAANGVRLLVRGLVANAAGALLCYALLSPPLRLSSTMSEVYTFLPLLVIYPIFIGWISFRVALNLSEHKHLLSQICRTDSLTGLFNHGSWKDLLELEFERSQHRHRDSCVALIDIDHFKAINDRHGHIVGDSVLKAMSQALQSTTRHTDFAGRYGGDEFCLILPDTRLEQAVNILERLRSQIEQRSDALLPDLKISLSIGVAVREPRMTDAGMWLHTADKALYQAKSTGRNRVVSAVADVQTTQALPVGA
ncbi:diguanylate cyclase [Pseudomonas sp. DTU_2021_1001937_2_SI_NGA_ILE_001]|uniref:diguanylate cyclase n=1 Tax=Pseudomonas sp. DTU_2021_1001937_2_SI_NGA_ILE_001 TaxID=3077589 RepID=UPI0028FC2EB6|nr:diguanylate cyclase [Pseudomonas sp. DTU_2021_1001937_2_SI_NGA_ILE_001]WNW13774.1 diguanylate cyclase [Pseudomonas sp. DTU_2021_1001937_2_SI_NGA_ILE_001]